MKPAAVVVAFALAGAFSSVATADAPPPAPSSVGAEAPPQTSAPSESTPKRAVPDYDGRGPEPTTVGDVALWVPRVLLSPLYFVSEYVIRWPLSLAVPAAERVDLPRKVYDFFTFGPNHNAGFAPVGYYDFGFNPSIGVYAFWNDAGFPGNDWHVHVEVWPSDWLAASLTDHIQIDARRAVQFRLEGMRRPDRVFYGTGPNSLQSYQSRYGEDTLIGSALYEWRFWRVSRIQTGVGVRAESTYDGHYGSDPNLTQEAATGAFLIPPGFGESYSVEYNRALLVVDTRRPWPAPGSGVRAEVFAEQDSEINPRPPSGWIRYGASAGSYVDLNQRQRVVSLSVTTCFVDPLGERPVPFTELCSLGGDAPLRGYYARRLVDRSAVAAAAHYTWPIGPWLGGTIEAGVGNVFGEHLVGYRLDRLRFSGDIGISTLGLSEFPIEAVFGVGSEAFENGGTIDSFRFTVSVNHGF